MANATVTRIHNEQQADLMKQLEKAGAPMTNGSDLAETAQGLCCVAAPLLDLNGRVLVAMSFCIPATRFYAQQEHYTENIVQTTRGISKKLGHPVKSEKVLSKALPGQDLTSVTMNASSQKQHIH